MRILDLYHIELHGLALTCMDWRQGAWTVLVGMLRRLTSAWTCVDLYRLALSDIDMR